MIDYGYLVYGLLLPAWFILTGLTLRTLGRNPPLNVTPAADDPANGDVPPPDTVGGRAA
jgi:hypothetical protein